MKIWIIAAAALIAAGLTAGCASTSTKADQYSGYLGDYSKLHEEKTASGEPIRRYISPKFTPARYRAVLLEPVVFYPEPQPSEQVSQKALDDIRNYLDQALEREFGKRFVLVQAPAQGTARINVALTAVGGQTEGLKPYQYIPVALVITGAKAAVSGRPEDAVIQVESKVTDSVTNERLYAGVRSGKGERLTQEGARGVRQVTAGELKPLIDKWAQNAATEAERFIAKR